MYPNLLFVSSSGGGIHSFEVAEGNAISFDYQVPIEAIGLDQNGCRARKQRQRISTRFDASDGGEVDADLDSLTLIPTTLYVEAEDASSVTLRGLFEDGVWRDLSAVPGVEYASADEGIATIDERGFVTGMGAGTAMLSASYQGQIAETEVVVGFVGSVAIEPGNDEAFPATFSLEQNYPNPFTGSTMITFSLPEPQRITLRVYDLLGREIAILANGEHLAGRYEVRLDANALASGVYIYRLVGATGGEVRRMTVVR